jgi:hypothetical protein
MSAEIIDTTDRLVTFRITGKLTYAEFAESQKQAGEIIKRLDKARFLALLEGFEGVEQEGDWGDVDFQMQFDKFIEKIAIVGDKKWEGMTTLFTGKGVRRVPIEFFETAELPQAKVWLMQ